MATQLFLTSTALALVAGVEFDGLDDGNQCQGTLTLGLAGTARGSAAVSTGRSVTPGPVNGTPWGGTTDGRYFATDPFAADVTIAGSITFNLRAWEGAMADNIGPQVVIYRLLADGTRATIVNSEQGVEMSTAEAARNWSATPTSTACKKGDRLIIVPMFNNVGASASAVGWLAYDGPTAGASGDTYVTFTETLTFQSAAPAGTTIYPTDTASDVATASVDREAWTGRGAGVVSDDVNSVVGPTAAIQTTDTAGGTVVDWFTRQLAAFTLAGAVKVNARGLESVASANARFGCGIAVVNSDGTGAVAWGSALAEREVGTTEGAQVFHVTGQDAAVAAGQRLRIRFFIDDAGTGAMASGLVTHFYAGATSGASGDTFLTFTQTITEFVPSGRGNGPRLALQAVHRAASW